MLSEQLHATHAQVEMLFTSYFLVTGIAMIVTGYVSSRLGLKRTLLVGLGLILVFSGLAGAASGVAGIAIYRGFWGLGNALFIATALAAIVHLSTHNTDRAVILYESALGLGIALGPLLGGMLGGISWRGPFFGVAVLMVIGFVALVVLLPKLPHAEHKSSLIEPVKALKYRGLATLGVTALCYNFGFFVILAYAPFPMGLGVHALGFIYFGWGLLLAVCAVFLAPRLQARFGVLPVMYSALFLMGLDLVAIAVGVYHPLVIVIAVVVSGAFSGVNNTLITTAVMKSAPVERSIAAASYSFVRFTGGAIAPVLAGILGAALSPAIPFYVGAAALFIAIAVLFSGRAWLRRV